HCSRDVHRYDGRQATVSASTSNGGSRSSRPRSSCRRRDWSSVLAIGESLAGDRLVPPPLDRTFDPQSVDRVARANALEPIGVRPKLTSYVRELWERRSFIKVLAVSKAYAENQNTYLGQLWTLFSPIMN